MGKENGRTFWRLQIGNEKGRLTIYNAATREELEKILSELKIPENIKIEIKQVEK